MTDLLESERAWARPLDREGRVDVHEILDRIHASEPQVLESRARIESGEESIRFLLVRAWALEFEGESLLVTAIRDETEAHLERESLIAAAHSLREQSLRDPLTELWNRRGFEAMAQQEVHCVRRTGLPPSAIFIDLDEFKSINERSANPAVTACSASSRTPSNAPSGRRTRSVGSVVTSSWRCSPARASARRARSRRRGAAAHAVAAPSQQAR